MLLAAFFLDAVPVLAQLIEHGLPQFANSLVVLRMQLRTLTKRALSYRLHAISIECMRFPYLLGFSILDA